MLLTWNLNIINIQHTTNMYNTEHCTDLVKTYDDDDFNINTNIIM